MHSEKKGTSLTSWKERNGLKCHPGGVAFGQLHRRIEGHGGTTVLPICIFPPCCTGTPTVIPVGKCFFCGRNPEQLVEQNKQYSDMRQVLVEDAKDLVQPLLARVSGGWSKPGARFECMYVCMYVTSALLLPFGTSSRMCDMKDQEIERPHHVFSAQSSP